VRISENANLLTQYQALVKSHKMQFDNDGKRDLHSRVTPKTWWMPWHNFSPKQVPIVLESRLQHFNRQAIQREYQQILTWLSD
jgi:hypothetical protein